MRLKEAFDVTRVWDKVIGEIAAHLEEAVAEQADKVGEHAEDDDVDVADGVGDGSGEDEEGEGGEHADGDGPAHVQLVGAEVVKEPEEESLDETPEDTGEHHHHQEYDNLEDQGQEKDKDKHENEH